MATLWYPKGFLDAVQAKRDQVRADLKVLQKKYNWPGGDLPSAAWVADRAGKRQLYDYLHGHESIAALLGRRDHAKRVGTSIRQNDN